MVNRLCIENVAFCAINFWVHFQLPLFKKVNSKEFKRLYNFYFFIIQVVCRWSMAVIFTDHNFCLVNV